MKFKLYLHYLYWIIAFSQGIFQLFGYPSTIYRVGIPLIVAVLFAESLIRGLATKTLSFPKAQFVVGILLISCLSMYLNGMSTFQFIYFLVYMLFNVLYFYIIINEQNQVYIRKVISLIKILFFIQVPAAFIKLVLVGQMERYIGTLHVGEGSLSAIFPAFAAIFLYSTFLYQRDKKYLFLILGFVFFGFVGDKRVLVIILPLMFLINIVLYGIKNKNISFSRIQKQLILGSILGLFLFYAGVRLLPTLNPQNKVGGEFDMEYFVEYVSTYTSSEGRTFRQTRRLGGLQYFASYLLNTNLSNFLLGEGAGKLIDSRYVENGTTEQQYGMRYGGRMSFVKIYLQIGLLGSACYLFFVFSLFRYVWRHFKPIPEYLAFLSLTFLFLFDFFVYSDVFFGFPFLNGVYLMLFGIIYLDSKNKLKPSL